MLKNTLISFILAGAVSFLAFIEQVSAGPIYVFKQADGSIKFTSRKPEEGSNFQVFTAKKSNFSTYKVTHGGRASKRDFKLFKNTYNEIIKKAATDNNIDPHLLKAVIHIESAFNCQAISPAGARGLMQLMPGTARDLGVRNAFRPEDNIAGGARHLARLVVKYNQNLRLALAAYNAGEETVQRYNGVPPYTETQNYVKRVLEMKERYRRSLYG